MLRGRAGCFSVADACKRKRPVTQELGTREACNKAEKDLLRGGQRPRKECRRNFELHAPQGVTPSLTRLCNWGNAVCNLLFILHYLIMCESMDFAKTAGCCWTMPACAKLAASARIP